MLVRLDLRGYEGDLTVALARPAAEADDVTATVAAVLALVRDRGDEAVRDLTERFDGARVDDLRVHRDEMISALDEIDPDVRLALEVARDQIVAWHEAQRERSPHHERLGVEISELVVPVDRAGCYVPGGRAAYPSTVLMTVIPARVAGVPEVVLCVPPDATGLVSAATLAAAAIAGPDEMYRVGGAQAIAAMAYGTDTIAPVDVIVGPGNAYVTEAKRQVFGTVGVDALAGPSELVVVADASAAAELVAADLLAQAEHGPGGRAALITWDEGVAEAVEEALEAQLRTAVRAGDARATLGTGGRLILTHGAEQAIEVANTLAPEHLQLVCEDADRLVPAVRHAGAVFCGPWATAVLGDYLAGANHVLPTGGAARFASGLRVATFQKHVHVIRVGREGFQRIAPHVVALAEAEGLEAHAAAVRRRQGRP